MERLKMKEKTIENYEKNINAVFDTFEKCSGTEFKPFIVFERFVHTSYNTVNDWVVDRLQVLRDYYY